MGTESVYREAATVLARAAGALLLGLVCMLARADCKTSLPLEGMLTVDTCVARDGSCRPAAEAVHEYAGRVAGNDDPAVLNLSLQASPWRAYDGEMRILTMAELAAAVRPHVAKGVKRVAMVASWSGVAPSPATPSLSQQLSALLNGMPVSGTDGFLWLGARGEVRTTRQAFTARQGSGPYHIKRGGEVMVSLAAGWPAELEAHFLKTADGEGMLRAGAGFDVYFLCPDNALRAFEAAAQLGNPVGAYNAALMRLARKGPGDLAAARTLLSSPAAAGDAKARALRAQLPR